MNSALCKYSGLTPFRRIQKIVSANNGSAYVGQSTNRYIYDGWNLIAILDHQSSILYSFTWGKDASGTMQGAGGVGGLISMTVHQGTNAGTYFYCYDGNHNVAGLVNASNGAMAGQWEYDPFLGIIRATGALAFLNPFLGSTKFYDWETGLYYYGYRYYDPIMGTWLSRDPRGTRGGLNLFGFLANAGVNRIDYLGLEGQIPYKINCFGHACDNGQYLSPGAESFKTVTERRGYSCSAVSKSAECKVDCEKECGFVLYIYIPHLRNPDATSEQITKYYKEVKDEVASVDLFNDDGVFAKHTGIDYHGIRRDCSKPDGDKAWNYVGQQKFKNPADPDYKGPNYGIDGTVADPNEFWGGDPDGRILAKFCCKKGNKK